MAEEYFVNHNFSDASIELILKCKKIITAYQAQGLRLSLRQLYYQLVASAEIPNTDKQYKALGGVVSKARYAGLLDWAAVEDRDRIPQIPSEWSSIRSIVESAIYSFRLNRLKGQDVYPEVWVEKKAMEGILSPVCDQHHVTLLVNKGYTSSSAAYYASKRIQQRMNSNGSRHCIIIYFGDLDPSGEDMVRDIDDRLGVFFRGKVSYEVQKVALTYEQVEQYKPPPNPAKLTDTRSSAFIEKYGESSWELDALPPDVLRNLVKTSLLGVLDMSKVDKIRSIEKDQVARLKQATAEITEDQGD